jgi:hypothetical protein
MVTKKMRNKNTIWHRKQIARCSPSLLVITLKVSGRRKGEGKQRVIDMIRVYYTHVWKCHNETLCIIQLIC